MTRVVTIRTDHEDMAAAVEALAPDVSEASILMTVPEAIGAGEWTRFRWLLRDETVFWEGVGRCASCKQAGARFTVVLETLSFDARNEAMFERIQLGLDDGRRTGKLPQVAKESVRPAPRYSSAPPPPRAIPPAPPPAKLPPLVKAGLRPKPGAPAPLRPPPMKPSGVTAAGELAERARVLSRQLNLAAPSLARGRWTEQRVLEVALRMGVEALEGLIAARDADG